jgi:ferritin
MALISEIIIEKLQERIAHEEANKKAYTAMKNWLLLKGFKGAAKLWGDYADDENTHKGWSVDYLLNMNILPIEPEQEEPQTEFKGLPNIIALSMQRELQTTEEVQELARMCLEEGDFLTFGLVQKYVAEQIEEVSKVQFWIDKLNSFSDSPIALRLLDDEMSK